MAAVIRARGWRPALALLLLAASLRAADDRTLGRPERVADGVRLYRVTDHALVDPPAPVFATLLRLDRSKVNLRGVLAGDHMPGTETVLDMSVAHQALAGVNAGFFAPNGDPAGLLKVGGELVSEMSRPRGAVAILPAGVGPLRVLFDRVTVDVTVRFEASNGERVVASAAIDTLLQRNRFTIYTPRYGDVADTPADGAVWVLRGRPLTVVERRDGAARTAIPRDGVLMARGAPTGAVHEPVLGRVVQVVPEYRTRLGSDPARWHAARDVIGGAGLLVRNGRALDDWTEEDLRTGFGTERHPRTMIGLDRAGDVWLVTVDGRQPGHSVGMTFHELQRLAARLQLRDALNLDGGGSTTMVVRGTIVNRPSDLQGPRKVSDALLVFVRRR